MVFNKKLLAIAILAAALVGCDDDPTPTAPTPNPTVTETFAGTVAASGAATHSFSVAASGTVKATLKAIGTDNTLVVSFALGNWFADACSIVLANDAATGGAVLSGTMTGAGTLCARVSDVGNIQQGQTVGYTIEIEHP